MTPVAIRESPQSRYSPLAPPLRPITDSRGSRALSPVTCNLPLATFNLPALSTAERLLGTCNLLPVTYNLSPFVTAADYTTTTRFRYPLPFQLLHSDRGVGWVTV